MRRYWDNLNDCFFVDYIMGDIKKCYYGADYYLYSCKLFKSLINKSGIDSLNNLKILDAGCSTGLPDFYFERKGAEMHLLDYSSDVLKNTQKNQFELKSKNVHYILGNIKSVPIIDDEFDVVWNEGVIEHFKDDDRDKILNEMVRVTKPGGLIILMTPNLFTPHSLVIKQIRRILNKFPFDNWGKEKAYTSKQLGELLNDSGLKDIQTGSCNIARTILDDFLVSYPFPIYKNKFFDKIRNSLLKFENRHGDLKCGFIAGAIGVKKRRYYD